MIYLNDIICFFAICDFTCVALAWAIKLKS